MKPVENTIITIDNSDEHQVLYFVEKPRFHFEAGNKEAIWNPIMIELPIRLMPNTEKWIENGYANTIRIDKQDAYDKVIHTWTLRDVLIDKKLVQRSRVVDSMVTVLIISYKYAQEGDADAVL